MRMIDADDVLRGIEELKKSPWYNAGKEIESGPFHVGFLARREAVQVVIDLCIKDSPAMDAELVRHGHIEIKVINPYDGEDCYCSECRHWSLRPDYKWCPYCGAKMDGEVE